MEKDFKSILLYFFYYFYRMKNIIYITLIATLISLSGCHQSEVSYSIDEGHIGQLHKDTKISELSKIYANDSIVTIDSIGLKNGNLSTPLFIYDTNGNQLLKLQPKIDTTQTIESIRVYDPRFKTAKNISIGSSYKDLKSTGKIDKILPAFNSIAITMKGSSIYYSIDRKELPDALKYDRTAKIEPIQIPDQALISNIMIQW